MDTFKYKNLAEKLSVLRDYSSLLAAVVIVLIAVLIFVFTPLIMGSKLKEKMQGESISMGRRVMDLNRDAIASRQAQVEKKYQDAYAGDANQIVLLTRQTTQRSLLSYKILPEPKDTSPSIFEKFGQRFRNAIDGLMARINAGDCPTDLELDRSSNRPSMKKKSKVRGAYTSLRSTSRKSLEVNQAIRDMLCRRKAEGAAVYAEPTELDGYGFWGEWKYTDWDEAVTDCWYWQLGYWIIEDVLDTIDEMNSGSESVFTSPVKRFMDIGFTTRRRRRFRRRQRRIAERRNMPSYVLSAEEGLVESCTGRFTNDDIDVVHFNVIVVVNVKAVLPFMQQLCRPKQHKFRGFSNDAVEQTFKHNQITVLESSIEPVDRKDKEHSLYRYGEDAVVILDLICEYIFNKNSYDEIKPESVKESLMKGR